MSEAILARGLDEVLEARRQGAVVCAGGTDLMVRHKRGYGLAPEIDRPVVFIHNVPELSGITDVAGALEIGAATTLTELGADPRVPEALKEVFIWFASPAIRNRATLGGNICNASPAGDTLPFLYAREAVVLLTGSDGTRELPIHDFITGPGTTALGSDELVTAVRIPVPAPARWFYRKVGPRRSNSLSKLAVYAEDCGGPGEPEVRIAVGGAAPTVVRVPALEAELGAVLGAAQSTADTRIEDVIAGYRNHIKPIDDQRSTAVYRLETAIDLIRYAIMTLRSTP